MAESAWHKLLKRDAKGWLAAMNDVYVLEEVALSVTGDVLYGGSNNDQLSFRAYKRGCIPLMIIDVVAFMNGVPIAGVECGDIRDPLRYKRLSFSIFHLASLFRTPHLLGGCSYCMTKREKQRNFDKNAPRFAIFE